jgi:hypothetical protein
MPLYLGADIELDPGTLSSDVVFLAGAVPVMGADERQADAVSSPRSLGKGDLILPNSLSSTFVAQHLYNLHTSPYAPASEAPLVLYRGTFRPAITDDAQRQETDKRVVDGTVTFETAGGWVYQWRGNRFDSDRRHAFVFKAYILDAQTGLLNAIAETSSPEFRVVCTRRSPHVRGSGESVGADENDVLSVMARAAGEPGDGSDTDQHFTDPKRRPGRPLGSKGQKHKKRVDMGVPGIGTRHASNFRAAAAAARQRHDSYVWGEVGIYGEEEDEERQNAESAERYPGESASSAPKIEIHDTNFVGRSGGEIEASNGVTSGHSGSPVQNSNRAIHSGAPSGTGNASDALQLPSHAEGSQVSLKSGKKELEQMPALTEAEAALALGRLLGAPGGT